MQKNRRLVKEPPIFCYILRYFLIRSSARMRSPDGEAGWD